MELLFVHHSVGRRIVAAGLREQLAAIDPSLQLWDHDYNHVGMTGPDNQRRQGGSLPMPDDNTDPPGLLKLLREAANGGELHSKLAKFEIFVLKSCYPNSNLASEAELASSKQTYLDIAEAASRLSQAVVILTSPPLVREKTTRDNSQRARELADWMASSGNLESVTVIDLFGALAARSGIFLNCLAMPYRGMLPFDSHPNGRGSRVAAKLVAKGVAEVARQSVRGDSSAG
jgi:hypothetical protein